MKKDLNLTLSPEEAASLEMLKRICARKLFLKEKDIVAIRFVRKSIDSRRRDVKINAVVRVYVGEGEEEVYERTVFKPCDGKRTAVVVGAGPAGLFAALRLIELGIRPFVLERGRDVHQRKRDVALLVREGKLDCESNYAFGEGGAGAFSDGKLYTRSVKRGDVGKVLNLFVQHGASADILIDAQPHIGSDVLPFVIENIRKTIIQAGGEVHFGCKVTGLLRRNDEVRGAVCADGREFSGPVILATGHSAHDVYHFLNRGGYELCAKDVAVGVRLEHPQVLIDRMQYHSEEGRGLYLPAATYRFVTQVNGRGVYSFCMCPGGIILPSATEEGHLAVNGMSPSSRNGKFANSGIVVQLSCNDIEGTGVFAMLDYIRRIEEKCFNEGFVAPAQRMMDFLQNRVSSSLSKSTYTRGLVSKRMDNVLPPLIASSLRLGLEDFVAKSRGKFLSHEALLIAPETRTSSAVRIVRGDNYCQVRGLYPCGEGAGYAGGIVSAALDGIACADALAIL